MQSLRPKIDYDLLARALCEYEARGYEYKECPWTVDANTIRKTIPNIGGAFRLSYGGGPDESTLWSDGPNFLVGSAEQSFLMLDLPPGRYVGITPCFRYEDHEDILTRYMFMKVELFVTSDETDLRDVIEVAYDVLDALAGRQHKIDVVDTEEGFDFMLGGIEIGSYGERTIGDLSWIYGTGLALPRFSAALALASLA